MTPFEGLEQAHYRVISADPPWPYNDRGTRLHPAYSGTQREAARYQTMSQADIDALPVANLAHPEGAWLVLWATAPLLPVCLATMGKWGFEYVGCGSWVKVSKNGQPRMGGGHHWRGCHELVLFGRIGPHPPKRLAANVKNVWLAPRTKHSAKPECVQDDLERLWPGPRCELFATRPRAHWDCWGDQLYDNPNWSPDPATVYIVTVSGGKDSTAVWLYLQRELALPNVIPVFADTGHEAPQTYEYLDYLDRELGGLHRVQGTLSQLRKDLPDEPLTMELLASHKGRFPAFRSRFCTTELKLKPLKRFVDRVVAEHRGEDVVVVNGVRAQESSRRSNMAFYCFDDFMGVDRWLPIHGWSEHDVFEMHRRHNVKWNPLYEEGMYRVGCFPCIMSRKAELKAIAQRFPQAFDRLAAMESRVGAHSKRGVSSFFPATKCAQKYRRQLDEHSGHHYALAPDVRDWALGTEDGGEDEEGEGEDLGAPVCLSRYKLCE